MVAHRHTYLLHGVLTTLTGVPHDPLSPLWALVPWPSPTGWAVYWWRDEEARRFGARGFSARFADKIGRVRFGLLGRVRTPVLARRGRSRITVTALTPVCCRNGGGSTLYTAPTAETLISTLGQRLARQLGLEVDAPDICLTMRDRRTEAATVQQGPKMGLMRGWVGEVDLEVNAVSRWLLEVAARGPGLGGRTALGFGRIRLTETGYR
jgi:hypothetical protein